MKSKLNKKEKGSATKKNNRTARRSMCFEERGSGSRHEKVGTRKRKKKLLDFVEKYEEKMKLKFLSQR